MLEITIPAGEFWDEGQEEFLRIKETSLRLEHSLVSLSKWESKWKKPFLGKGGRQTQEMSREELLDYVRCMTLTQNVDPIVYRLLNAQALKQILEYSADPMTATWFSESKKKSVSRETLTAELIYYYMIQMNIPFECQKWHLNRLMTLIRVIGVKNDTKNKKPLKGKALAKRNRALNAQRRARLGTKG